MNAYIKLLVFVLWPGVVAIMYGMLFLTTDFQIIYFKWIAFVYVLVLPAILFAFLDQRRYDKEVQHLKDLNR